MLPLKTLCISVFTGIQNKLLQKECIALAYWQPFLRILDADGEYKYVFLFFGKKIFTLVPVENIC